MGDLRREGLIREWGMSQVSAAQLAQAHAITPVAAVQNLYNMMERDCEADIFPLALREGIAAIAFSPVGSGFLSGAITSAAQFEAVDDVRVFVPQLSAQNIEANAPLLALIANFAGLKGATNAQIALAWMLHKYPNVVPIPGSKNLERILENLRVSEVCFTEAEFSELEKALSAIKIHGHRGHVEGGKAGTFGDKWKKG